MYIADCFSFRFFGGPMMPAFFSVVLQVVRSRPSGAGFILAVSFLRPYQAFVGKTD